VPASGEVNDARGPFDSTYTVIVEVRSISPLVEATVRLYRPAATPVPIRTRNVRPSAPVVTSEAVIPFGGSVSEIDTGSSKPPILVTSTLTRMLLPTATRPLPAVAEAEKSGIVRKLPIHTAFS